MQKGCYEIARLNSFIIKVQNYMTNTLYSLTMFSLTIISACFLTSCESKQSSSTTNPTAPTSSVEETVEDFNMALVKRDRATLEGICADELSYGHSSGLAQDKQTFIEDAVNGPFEFLSVTTENQQVSLSDDMAIVRHIFLADAVNKGDSVQVRIGNAQLYRLDEKGKWRLVLRQAYRL